MVVRVFPKSNRYSTPLLSLQFSRKFAQPLNNNAFGLTTLLKGACGRKRESTDGTTSSATSSEDVLSIGIDFRAGQLPNVHVRGVRSIGSIVTISLADDDIEEILESRVAVLVTWMALWCLKFHKKTSDF